MVVFTCGNCGEALKKNQVEKHYATQCRNCNVLSCIDCSKDFWGNDYQQHTKCISEEEKYSGKNYVPKPNANKGEMKQQGWLQKVQTAIENSQANPSLRNVLERMKDYPNIPRKRPKFKNFLGNSLRIHNSKLCDQLWDILMASNTEEPDKTKDSTSTSNKQTNGSKLTEIQSTNGNSKYEEGTVDQPDSSDNVKRLNKRERKEERRKDKHKKEKKDKSGDNEDNLENGLAEKTRKKKRKHNELEVELDSAEGTGGEESQTGGEENQEEMEELEEEEEEPAKKRYKTKFDWEAVILQVVKSKGGEITVKKVRKKVLAEYLAHGCTAKSEEKLWAKFEKKLKKNPNFKVFREKVKLVNQVVD